VVSRWQAREQRTTEDGIEISVPPLLNERLDFPTFYFDGHDWPAEPVFYSSRNTVVAGHG